MRFTYSPGADTLGIDLVPGGQAARTIRFSPEVAADFDDTGRLLYVEILGASAWYPKAELEQLDTPVAWLTLAEAAKESGLAAATLRVQLNQGRLEGRKLGRDWQVARHVLWNYLENRDPRGRPATKRKARRSRKVVEV